MGIKDRLVIGRRGPGYTDQMIVDWWSVIHFASGVVLSLIGLEFLVAFSLLLLFEVWENNAYGLKFLNNLPEWTEDVPILSKRLNIESQSNYVGDSWGNLLFDILIGLAGFWAGGYL